ncbi:MAG: glutamine--tRNA ligase/YqeY domain fusion protein [Rhodothermales bacterium]
MSEEKSRHFIQQIIDQDRASGRVPGDIITRFPPEPNGYLHIGHAKAICLNFGLAEEYGGRCHLRYDDTNPETEDMEYVRSIQDDVRWLGYDWDEHLYFASDYFEQLYGFAEDLIRQGRAYVDSQDMDEIRATRGTVTEPGTNSPYRDRSVEENLDLFRRMRAGEFPDGAHVLRAKIDMASPNMLMRDPLLYRIRHAEHYRTGNTWCIYPMYDMAHPLEDAIENITHSLCTLEFEVHRPLYDWLVDAVCAPPRPHQYEFARLNLDYTVTSKRKLLLLVKGGHVEGWDDPRMPTIAGLRRRGIRPEALRAFCDLIGVAKADNRVDISLLEYAIRDDLNAAAPRAMAVLDPLKMVITNWPEGVVDELKASYWPPDHPLAHTKGSTRMVPFGRELWMERSDFMETPPRNFHRLSPGQEVRLRNAYIVKCQRVVKGPDGAITEVHCTYDPDSRSGSGAGAARRVKGTIHWVSAAHAVPVEVRLYDRLFHVPNPDVIEEGQTFLDHLNPDSLQVIPQAWVEPAVAEAEAGARFQFERNGYFYRDPVAAAEGRMVWNRTITLRDTWAKQDTGKAVGSAKARVSAPAATEPTSEPTAAPPVAFTRDPLSGLDDAGRARVERLQADFAGLSLDDAAVLATSAELDAYFRDVATAAPGMRDSATNWLIHEVRPMLPEDGIAAIRDRLTPTRFVSVLALHAEDVLSNRLAREVLKEVMESGAEPDAVVDARGLRQISDTSALTTAVQAVVEAHPDRAQAYRDGKTGLIGFFMGQVMQRTGGKANPQVVKEMLEERLAAQ